MYLYLYYNLLLLLFLLLLLLLSLLLLLLSLLLYINLPPMCLQKPIMLQGHERSITQIKFNREGDLLFSASKDPKPNVWYSINGERLGSYDGHSGTVWCIDVKWDSSLFISGSADQTMR